MLNYSLTLLAAYAVFTYLLIRFCRGASGKA